MNISKSDLKFIKSYRKEKSNYGKEQNLIATNFDIEKKQVPLMVFNRINKEQNKSHKYNWGEHKNRIYDILSHQHAIEIEGAIREINSMEDPLWESKY